jgi:hypothetical protein
LAVIEDRASGNRSVRPARREACIELLALRFNGLCDGRGDRSDQ